MATYTKLELSSMYSNKYIYIHIILFNIKEVLKCKKIIQWEML